MAKCTRPRKIRPWKSTLGTNSPVLEVDCGKCLNCRINKTREWTMRLLHEAQIAQNAIFITLTYDDAHLPTEGVRKQDVQDFISDLRKICGPGLRYFIGSEYGEDPEHTRRPHYHGFLFNAPDWLRDTPCTGAYRVEKRSGKSGHISFVNTYYNDIWRRGYVSIGDFHPRRAGYLAHYYVDKGDSPEGFEPNFSLMSRRPGIGSGFFSVVSDKVIAGKPLISHCGTAVGIPRYYRRLRTKLTGEVFNPGDLDMIKKINDSKKIRSDLAEALEIRAEKVEKFKTHKQI